MPSQKYDVTQQASSVEVPAAPLSLSALTAAVKEAAAPLRTVDIDISAFIPGAPLLTLRELDAPRLFQVPADAETIRKQNPQWPENLAETVALLAMAHVAPVEPGQPAGPFYVAVAASNRHLLSHILKTYKNAFPESITPTVASESEAKND